ncbi:MAG: ribosome maturation factor RimM [Steroidobacteraceae bacterium]|nr:ribosome maturation factor RimM [Steroidobacteraceae bacterium]
MAGRSADRPLEQAGRMVVLGRLTAPWGVKGWIKAESYTDPPAGILDYPTWFLARPARGDDPGGWDEMAIVEGRAQGGRHVVVSLPGVEDPETARLWVARDVAVPRSALPEPAPGEYYWDDLEGCRVVTLEGRDLGVVAHLMDMPANPVLVVRGERERWLPLVREHVKRVDTAARLVTVDWDPEF